MLQVSALQPHPPQQQGLGLTQATSPACVWCPEPLEQSMSLARALVVVEPRLLQG